MTSRESVEWRTSSFSGSTGNCVEVAWRTSSFTGSNGNCVEVAWPEHRVAIRDSKNTSGPTIEFPRSAWAAFLAQRP